MTSSPSVTLSGKSVHAALERLVSGVDDLLASPAPRPAVVLGIANGGLNLAVRLSTALSISQNRDIPHGCLNPNFYRDDIGANPIPSAKATTRIPVDITGTDVVLADDVFESGRTVRAALGELFALGRPARVFLAVLCDRKCAVVPIRPDACAVEIGDPLIDKVQVTIAPVGPSEHDSITIVRKA